MQRTISELETQHAGLEADVASLRNENGLLRVSASSNELGSELMIKGDGTDQVWNEDTGQLDASDHLIETRNVPCILTHYDYNQNVHLDHSGR